MQVTIIMPKIQKTHICAFALLKRETFRLLTWSSRLYMRWHEVACTQKPYAAKRAYAQPTCQLKPANGPLLRT